jgi:hypothetical protein
MRRRTGSDLLAAIAVAILGSACSTAVPTTELRSQSGVAPAAGAPASVADPSRPANSDPTEPAAAADDSAPKTAAETVPAEETKPAESVPAKPKPSDPTVIVIEDAAPVVPPERNLIAASQREKARRETAGRPVAVITDKNLADHARSGRVTTGPAPQTAPATVPDPAIAALASEVAWRDRVRALRQTWRDNSDAIPSLEKEVADQRVRFYAEDDPFVRDGRIKPAWDLALDRLEHRRRAIETSREELTKVLEEARSAGIPQAWLDEGIELEPETPVAAESRGGPREPQTGAESREPRVVEQPPVAQDPPQ